VKEEMEAMKKKRVMEAKDLLKDEKRKLSVEKNQLLAEA